LRKVLIVGHLDKSIGSFRPFPLASHLSEFGYEPIVLTGEVNGYFPFAVVETLCPLPFAWLRGKSSKSISLAANDIGMGWISELYQIVFCYPDTYKGWTKYAVEAGSRIIEKNKIDIILSCYPVTGHIIASKLKEKYGIPWVADFTDYWADNPSHSFGRVREWFNRRIENSTMKGCDAIVTVTHPLANYLKEIHHLPVHVITHGFEHVTKPAPKLTDKFTITYTGTIYQGYQHPSLLFSALKELIIEGNIKDVEVRLYGNRKEWVDELISEYELEDIVKQHGMISNEESIERQRESQLLWLMNWDDPLNRMFCPYKLFEYLGSERPIIATGGEGNTEVRDLLRKTNAGLHLPSLEDIKGMLMLYYKVYKKHGHIGYNGINAEINKYNATGMTKKFVELFEVIRG
jgi:glycosyltransferase involved in cell wall biosynthesis